MTGHVRLKFIACDYGIKYPHEKAKFLQILQN